MQFGHNLRNLPARFQRNLSGSMNPNDEGWDVENLIKGIKMFSQLDAKQVKKLARLFIPRDYSKGEMMIQKGDTGLGMFVIVSGQAEVFDKQNGEKIVLATLGAGDVVGDMSLIDERPRSANVQVTEDTESLLLTRDKFKILARRDADILWGIVPIVVERLRSANEKLASSSDATQPVQTKEESSTSDDAPDSAIESEPDVSTSQGIQSGLDSVVEEEETVATMADEPEGNDNRLIPSFFQLSTASFMFFLSMYFLGTQEMLRPFLGKNSLNQRLDKSQNAVSSLTERIEENMSERTRKVYNSFQEFLSSLLSLFGIQ